MKIVIDKDIPYAHNLFSRLGEVQAFSGREISSNQISQADALIVRSVTVVNKNLLHGSRVKFVGTVTTGIDHIDQYWLSEVGIRFSYAPGCNSIAVVEYVLSSLFFLSWKYGFSLREKTIGIIGVGNIGGLLHKRLESFGIYTLLYDPPLEQSGIHKNLQSLETLVANADILTFHVPLTYNGSHPTWHKVSIDLLSSLSDNSIIINTSRGAVIDNTALLNILKSGKKLHVVLDVWESEPDVLFQLLDYIDIGTPHIAGYTLEGKIRGIYKVFNDYRNFVYSTTNLNIDSLSLLPIPIIEKIRLHGKINEELLRKLIHLIYNVQSDDIALRRINRLPEEFDILRNNYSNRRELSSLCIETDDDFNAKILTKIGFCAFS